jgi:hypothetical protein
VSIAGEGRAGGGRAGEGRAGQGSMIYALCNADITMLAIIFNATAEL